jgi:hypothetical protein
MSDIGPPPGAVHELAEQAVDFVRKAVGIALDYTSETLPIVDHYLRAVPEGRTEIVGLVATAVGAYFGEVVRRQLGGLWDADADDPRRWTLTVGPGLRFSPVGVTAEAIARADSDDGAFEVPEDDRAAVEAALDEEVSEEEYYSLSGRLDAFERIADVLAARRQP